MAAPKFEIGDVGPFRGAQLPNKARYELSDGHPIYCAPQGGDNARATFSGGLVIGTDPGVADCGFDAGYSTGEKTLRAPDIAVGNVPDRPGWIAGVPQLALEYAGVGQDEPSLVKKIDDFLDAGTRWVWVVRLVGPRRVEVHQKGHLVAHFGPDDLLTAPGVLENAIPVKALYDREVAQQLALSNLLQRSGYRDLDAVRQEGEKRGREEGLQEGEKRGREEGLREGEKRGREEGLQEGEKRGREEGLFEGQRGHLRRLLIRKFTEIDAHTEALLAAATQADLDCWGDRLLFAPSLKAVFEE